MVWQDYVITIANLMFVFSLFNQVYYGYKIKKGLIAFSTSVPTFIGLYFMSFAFFSLSLYFSSLSVFISGCLWVVLFTQRIIYGEA